MKNLLEKFFSGDRKALSRVLTMIEDEGREKRSKIIKKIWGKTKDNANVIGITGPPGVGKSSLVNGLIKELSKNNKIGVIAVDPSSPKSGGALLGDRVRLELSSNDNVFVRSMATRGSMGGLTKSTNDVIRVMNAFGFDYILLETVGAGQSEVDVMKCADTVVLVSMPSMGDDIQALKAGLIEIGDIFVVNKSDKEGADRKVFELESVLKRDIFDSRKEKTKNWNPPIIKTVATKEKGIGNLVNAIEDHRRYLVTHNKLKKKEIDRIREELLESMNETIKLFWEERKDKLNEIADQVLKQEKDPYSASNKLIEILKEELQ